MYVGKHIEKNLVGKAIAYVGNNSFYVMVLHFVGFKLCTLSLNAVGCGGGNLADLTPNIGNNVALLLLYAIFGVGFPLVFMWGFRRVNGLFVK